MPSGKRKGAPASVGKAAPAPKGKRDLLWVGLLATAAFAVAYLFFSLGGKSGTDSGTGYEKLLGRWAREDGGYVLEVRGVAADGTMEVGYFNPKPIKVARGEASRDGDTLQVVVELRDVNYPGSTYTLRYDPG